MHRVARTKGWRISSVEIGIGEKIPGIFRDRAGPFRSWQISSDYRVSSIFSIFQNFLSNFFESYLGNVEGIGCEIIAIIRGQSPSLYFQILDLDKFDESSGDIASKLLIQIQIRV